jgi:hypothetical protein
MSKSRSGRVANYQRKIGAQTQNVRERAVEKKRQQAPAPSDARATELARENPSWRIMRKLDEDRGRKPQPTTQEGETQ